MSFHATIAEATPNSLIIASMAAVAAVWKTETEENFQHAIEKEPGIFDRMNRQHRGILEAIISRNPDQARERMTEHILDMSRKHS